MDVPRDLRSLKKALQHAGFEVYRARGDTVELAERIRLHIMDAGVYIVLSNPPQVRFIARCQRSDFPAAEPDQLFDRVRTAVAPPADERGFREIDTRTHQVRDPVDEDKILDTWHEVVFARSSHDLDDLISATRWAMETEKYIGA